MDRHLMWILTGLRRDLDNLMPGQNSALNEVKEKLIAATQLLLGIDSSYEQEIAKISGNWDVTIGALKQWVDKMIRELNPEWETSLRDNHPISPEIKPPVEESQVLGTAKVLAKEQNPEPYQKLPPEIRMNEDFSDANSFDLIALAFFESRDIMAAEQVYLDGLKKHPTSDLLWTDYADLLIEKKEFEKAIQACQKAIALNPKAILAWQRLGYCENVLGHLQNVANAHKKVLEIDPTLWKYWTFLGVVSKKLGNLSEAVKAYEQALKIVPDDVKIWTDLGIVRMELGDFNGSVQAHQKAIAINPDFAPAWNNLAATYLEMNTLDKAEEAAKKAIAIDPEYSKGHLTLSSIQLLRGKSSDAESEGQEAVKLDPTNTNAQENLEQIRFIKTQLPRSNRLAQDQEEKKPDLDSSSPLSPSESFPQRLKREAHAYYIQGKITEARETYLDYLKHYPNDAEVWIQLGEMSLEAGKKRRAEQEFQECLKHDPNNAHAKDRLEQLRRLKERKSSF